jgi:hypothetical protein
LKLINGDALLEDLEMKTGVDEFQFAGYQYKCNYRKTNPMHTKNYLTLSAGFKHEEASGAF